MTALLLTSLFLLVPLSGVVSGGRETAFSTITGLIPSCAWLAVPGIPARDIGTFTEVTYSSGYNNSFRVISSGETAGLDPLIASCVTKNGFAGQILSEDLSVYCVKNDDAGSYAVSYLDAVLDVRGSSTQHLSVSG
ncbi:MAG: hypothetical protein GY852_11160 [bacterium]|nr:hypothetical protein [bacterium]